MDFCKLHQQARLSIPALTTSPATSRPSIWRHPWPAMPTLLLPGWTYWQSPLGRLPTTGHAASPAASSRTNCTHHQPTQLPPLLPGCVYHCQGYHDPFLCSSCPLATTDDSDYPCLIPPDFLARSRLRVWSRILTYPYCWRCCLSCWVTPALCVLMCTNQHLQFFVSST